MQRCANSVRPILPVLLLALLFPSLCRCAPSSTQISLSPDDDVRAAILFHLTQFVEWPDREGSQPYRICVAGSSATGVALEHLTRGKAVGSHTIRVQQIAGPPGARGCDIVFIAACAPPRLQQYLTTLRDANILTVGEQPGFVDGGGMIQLFFQGGRAGLVVNLENIQRSHLTVSSKLLRLGHHTGERATVESR